MADRYLDESDMNNPDEAERGERRLPIRRRRRIRVTEDGMPVEANVRLSANRAHSREYPDYAASDSSSEPAEQTASRRGRYGTFRQPATSGTAMDDSDAAVGTRMASFGRRMPQLPIHGGLSDLIGRGRLAMALLMGLLAFVGYSASGRNALTKNALTGDALTENTLTKNTLANAPTNPVAAKPISLLAEHDIALGQKTARHILLRHGGISNDENKRSIVKQVGARLVESSEAGRSRFQFTFDVLADDRNIGAFAMPGGRIYLTAALLDQLTSHGEIAGILAREMAHVTQRHGVVRLANASLAGGTTGAVVMASFLDPENYRPTSQDVTHLIAQTVQLRYDPSEVQTSDQWAVHYMAQAGFHPESLVSALRRVTEIKGQPTSFALRHQSPENQLALIQQQIRQRFPNGIPSDFIR